MSFILTSLKLHICVSLPELSFIGSESKENKSTGTVYELKDDGEPALSSTPSTVERPGNALHADHTPMTSPTGGNNNMPHKRQFPKRWQSRWECATLPQDKHSLLVLIGPGSVQPKCHMLPTWLIWPPRSRNVASGKSEKGKSCNFCKGRIPSQWPFQKKHRGEKKHIPLLLTAQFHKAFTHT